MGSSNNNLDPFKVGRLVGILLLLQLITGLTMPFILAGPITVGSPAFLTVSAEYAWQIRSAVLLSFVGSALIVYLGITMFPVFRNYSKSVALLFLVVCTISCILDLVHAGTIMSLLRMSTDFVASGSTDTGSYEIVGAAVATARRSTHMTQLLAIGAWMFIFYLSLFRFNLLPRVLAGIGIMGVILQFTGVTLMMLLGFGLIGEMAMPLLPIQVTVSLWLIIKGFNRPSLQHAIDS